MGLINDDDLTDDWATLQPQREAKVTKTTKGTQRSGVLDVNELRQITEKAIQEGKAKKTQIELAAAEKIITQVQARAKKEASRGKDSCIVKKLRDTDYEHVKGTPGQYTEAYDIRLKGAIKIVWDRMKAANMRVEIKRESGNYNPFSIVLWW